MAFCFILVVLQKKILEFLTWYLLSVLKKKLLLSLNIASTVSLSHTSLTFKVLHLLYAFFGVYPVLYFLLLYFPNLFIFNIFVNRFLYMFYLIYSHPMWGFPPLLHIFGDVLNPFVLRLDVLILVSFWSICFIYLLCFVPFSFVILRLTNK